MKKVFYEKPTTETLVVRFEGVICGSPDGSWGKSIKSGSKWDSNDEDNYGLE